MGLLKPVLAILDITCYLSINFQREYLVTPVYVYLVIRVPVLRCQCVCQSTKTHDLINLNLNCTQRYGLCWTVSGKLKFY